MAERWATNHTYIQELELHTPWPSLRVRDYFNTLLASYQRTALNSLNTSSLHGPGFEELAKSFRQVCESVLKDASAYDGENTAAQTQRLSPQELTSVLAMLLHCKPAADRQGKPTNERRPRVRHSTYPNSPGLSRLLADVVFQKLFSASIPKRCDNAHQARAFANRALSFKVLDPSMESGQLLLALAERWIRLVFEAHEEGSPAAVRLLNAGLGKLCKDVLWGIDRNPLAVTAVRTGFEALCYRHSLSTHTPRNLITTDFLTGDLPRSCYDFDALINNPPWGEKLGAQERRLLRTKYKCAEKYSDSYLAYVEKSIGLLKQAGAYALVLPASVASTSKAAALRGYLTENSSVDSLMLLPRQVFKDAAIRSLLLTGTKDTARRDSSCAVVSPRCLGQLDTPQRRLVKQIGQRALRSGKNSGWASIISERWRRYRYKRTTELAAIATVYAGGRVDPEHLKLSEISHSGNECRRLFSGPLPFGYAPVIFARNVHRYALDRVCAHVTVSSLADSKVPAHGPSHDSVLVRRFVDKSGRLTAAHVPFRTVPVRGVFVLKPMCVDPDLLTAILNSSVVADWVISCTGTFVNSEFRQISGPELRRLPVPEFVVQSAADGSNKRSKLLTALCSDISLTAKQLGRLSQRSREYSRLMQWLDHEVRRLYELM